MNQSVDPGAARADYYRRIGEHRLTPLWCDLLNFAPCSDPAQK